MIEQLLLNLKLTEIKHLDWRFDRIKKRNWSESECKKTVYNICQPPKRDTPGGFYTSLWGLFWSSLLRSDGYRNGSDGKLDLKRGSQRRSKLSLLKVSLQAWVHSDQMVLVMVRLEAEPHERRPKTFKGELENNARKSSDLVWKLA